jgi:tetratricopeptide (TPR) repeat protein
MRSFAIMLAIAMACATPALAADKPAFGPTPAWVRPVAIPNSPDAPDDQPVKILLMDQQVAFERDKTSTYGNLVMKIQNGQGLAAGNISLPWRPEFDVLTVHKLLIHRGNETIDVLAAGQTFTVVRREANLEMAMLDGVLTANIQPEGLQVGDLLEVASTVTTTDPTLKGHVEEISGLWNAVPVGRAAFRAQWPTDMAVKIRSGDLPPLKPNRAGDLTIVELAEDNVEPVPPPKGAPQRYYARRLIELSDFGSWADVSALMAPLYEKAARIPAEGQLRTELDRIRAASSDPKARTEAALALVQDRIRYVALAMGVGGLVPADAETTWSRRFGDCKGKTALLLALLDELDVEAEPVLVNTSGSDGLDERLPMVGMFDHVIVRAQIGGKSYWLDGTRSGDTNIDRLRTPAYHWGLLVKRSKGALVPMMPAPLAEPDDETNIRIDATAGLSVPAPFHVELVKRGDGGLGFNQLLNSLSADQRDRRLRDYWRSQFDFVEIGKVASRFDMETGEMHLSMDGLAQMDWDDGWYETDDTRVGYRADFSRHPGPSQDAPFAVAHPFFSRATETILLPKGFEKLKPADEDDVNVTLAGVEYRRRVTVSGNIFTVEKSERSLTPEVPFKEAVAAEKPLRELASNAVFIKKPSTYVQTQKEREALIAVTPTDAEGFVARGNTLLDMWRHDEAIADFNKALALDPKNVWAIADRGIAQVWKNRLEEAKKDLDSAEALDPKNPVVFRGRGLLAERQGKFEEAATAYSRSLELDPENMFAIAHRGQMYRLLGEDEKALADAAAAIKGSPAWVDPYILQANILRSQSKYDAAAKVADALIAANPDQQYALVAAAMIYNGVRKRAESMRAFDQALAVKPDAYVYINRSRIRPKDDVAGRLADIDEALKLDPTSQDALALRADTLAESGKHAEAIAIYTQLLSATPGHPMHLIGRGLAFARKGEIALAEKDFADAKSSAKGPQILPPILNNLCWAKATAGLVLESALADCEEALAKAPDEPAFLDSRAFVLLRLDRLDEAIATYDKALAKRPRQSASLFGRAIAWSRKGDQLKSQTDAEAALKVNPDVATEFEGYGLKP